MRRLLLMALGAAAGAVLVRRLAASGGPAGGLGERFDAFAAEVRAAMAQREIELRAAVGLDAPGSDVTTAAAEPNRGPAPADGGR